MSKYLYEDLGYTVKEKQTLFQCRMNDLDVKANRRWKYDDITCRSFKDQTKLETQQHVICCRSLVDRNMKITYLREDIEQQMYTSMVLTENVRLKGSSREKHIIFVIKSL